MSARAPGGRAPEEINWDRLDKKKFFISGVGLFSGLTTLLYPVGVLKTRQMASDNVSGGLKGVKTTAQTIWRKDGVRGFYRGYGTVVCGTIPARIVYLSVLESMKGTVMQAGQRWNVDDTTLAGASNFLGGAFASLATQSVVVPIDVVSQRQMLHGAGGSSRAPSSAAMAAAPAGGAAAAPRPAAAATNVPHEAMSAMASPPAGPQAGAGAPPAGTGTGAQRPFSTSAAPRCSSSLPQQSQRFSTAAAANGAARRPASAAFTAAAASLASSERCLSHYAASTSGGATAAFAGRPELFRQAAMATAVAPGGRRHLAAAAAAAVETPGISGLQMARQIIAQEGVRGLYKGFGVSVALFVPSSSIWWGAYGVYQRLAWDVLYHHRRDRPHSHSTAEVAAVQTASGVLAGCTSATLTSPLDLIKTRLQVARGGTGSGEDSSYRAVAKRVWREGGFRGLFRGVVPRCMNAALWGTCMVSAYEFLKRTCQLPEAADGAEEAGAGPSIALAAAAVPPADL